MTNAVDDYIREHKRVLVHGANRAFYVGEGFTSDTSRGALLVTLKNAWLLMHLDGYESILRDAAKETPPQKSWARLPGLVTIIADAVYEMPTNPKPTG